MQISKSSLQRDEKENLEGLSELYNSKRGVRRPHDTRH